MHDWISTRLGDVARIEIGGTPSRNVPRFWANPQSGYFWLSIADLTEKYVSRSAERITEAGVRNSNVKLIPAGTPVMSFKLTIGRCAIARDNLYSNEAIAAFHFDPSKVDAEWLYYELPRAASRASTDTAIKGVTLNKAKLVELTARLPPLPEQRQIAAILDTIDDAIRKTEQLIAKLNQVKQGLLHDLLTCGIDHNGELRDPQRHPEQFKDSPLGRIPRGWEVGGLMDVGASDRQAILTRPFGAQLGSLDFVPEGVPVLRIGNVQWGHLDLAELLFVRPRKADALGRWRVRAGDLLFARQGATTGRNALATEDVDGAVINYHIIRVAFDIAKCHPMFMCALFNSPIVQEQADREKGRGTREGVNTTTLTSFILPLPTKGEQDQLARVLETHDERVEMEKQSRRKLGLLKQGLMEDLLTGRVRVTKLLEDAAE